MAHVHKFGLISVPPEYGHSYLRCVGCPLSKMLPEHDKETCAICKQQAALTPTDAASPVADYEKEEVERRMVAVIDAAVGWHKSDADWFEKSEALGDAIDSLLELRAPVQPPSRIVKPAASFQPPDTCPECKEGVPFDEHGKHVKR